MKSKKWLIAVVLGIAAGGLHLTYVRGLENKKLGGEPVSCLAVSKRVPAGEKITKKDLGTREIPAAYVDPRAVNANKADEIEGLTASLDLEPGQIVHWTDFTARINPNAGDLSQKIESGKRAVTIAVDKSLAMGGLLRPGHRVDIIGTFAPKSSLSFEERVTATLLQNILVLATGTSVAGNDDSQSTRFSTVTLSVGLEEAELIALSSTSGKLSLVLRGRQDLSVVRDVPEKKMEDVFDADKRNSLQKQTTPKSIQTIERLRAQ